MHVHNNVHAPCQYHITHRLYFLEFWCNHTQVTHRMCLSRNSLTVGRRLSFLSSCDFLSSISLLLSSFSLKSGIMFLCSSSILGGRWLRRRFRDDWMVARVSAVWTGKVIQEKLCKTYSRTRNKEKRTLCYRSQSIVTQYDNPSSFVQCKCSDLQICEFVQK